MGGMQIAETSATEKLSTATQLVNHSQKFWVDFSFSQIVQAQDSPKLMFDLMMDAFRPFLGQYYQACSRMHEPVSRLAPHIVLRQPGCDID